MVFLKQHASKSYTYRWVILLSISLLFSGEDAIPSGGGVSFNVDFKPVKKSKRRRKIKKRAQTPMKPKVEDKQNVSSFYSYLLFFRSFA